MSLYQTAVAAVEPRDTFMERLCRTLEVHGVPHARLAHHADVHPALFSRWANGRSQPSMESMLRLLEALDKLLYGRT